MKRIKTVKVMHATGLKGTVRAFLFSEFDSKAPLFGTNGEQFELQSFSRKDADFGLLTFKNYSDRTSAETLKGKFLYQDVELKDSEFWIDNLVGKDVQIGAETAGILSIVNYGAGDILELSYKGKKVLIPFKKKFFEEVKRPDKTRYAFKIDPEIFKTFLDL